MRYDFRNLCIDLPHLDLPILLYYVTLIQPFPAWMGCSEEPYSSSLTLFWEDHQKRKWLLMIDNLHSISELRILFLYLVLNLVNYAKQHFH